MNVDEVRAKFEQIYKARIAGHIFFEGKYVSTKVGFKSRTDSHNTQEINDLWVTWKRAWEECLASQ